MKKITQSLLSNNKVHFPAYDLNGNVMGLVNATNGNISAKYEYGPFGEVFCSVGDMAKVNPFQFSTKYTDTETELLYYGYRYYSPALGRWLSRDPIEEQGGLNLYGFVDNDPVNKWDKLGLRGIGCGYGVMGSDTDGIISGNIQESDVDIFRKLILRWRSGIVYPFVLSEAAVFRMMRRGDNVSIINAIKNEFKSGCINALKENKRSYKADIRNDEGGYLEAWYLGSHSRKFTGEADCCTKYGTICLEVNDTWDFDEDTFYTELKFMKWRDRGKTVGSWGVGGLIGVGAWWRVEAFPVSGKACISVNLNKIK